MAKLYFYYSAMNAGKSTILLQSAYNYKERGMDALLFKPIIDTRDVHEHITSRIGIGSPAVLFDQHFDFYSYVQTARQRQPLLHCVFVDEAQFLLKHQVLQLTKIVDELNLPVLTYGLRSDFQGEPFEGSLYLLVLADNIIEIKTICHCGKKATMNMRIDHAGHKVTKGDQIQIGDNDTYVSVCRKHFYSP